MAVLCDQVYAKQSVARLLLLHFVALCDGADEEGDPGESVWCWCVDSTISAVPHLPLFIPLSRSFTSLSAPHLPQPSSALRL